MQTFVGAEPEHHFHDVGLGQHALAMGEQIDEAGRRQHFETLVDADVEFRRYDRAFDRAELQAFDLARHRAELAGGIELDLDAVAGILFQQGLEQPGELFRRVVDGRRTDLHHIGLVVGARGAERHDQCQAQCRDCDCRSACRQSKCRERHVTSPNKSISLPAAPLRPRSDRRRRARASSSTRPQRRWPWY